MRALFFLCLVFASVSAFSREFQRTILSCEISGDEVSSIDGIYHKFPKKIKFQAAMIRDRTSDSYHSFDIQGAPEVKIRRAFWGWDYTDNCIKVKFASLNRPETIRLLQSLGAKNISKPIFSASFPAFFVNRFEWSNDPFYRREAGSTRAGIRTSNQDYHIGINCWTDSLVY